MSEFFTSIEFRSYGPIRDARLELTPLTALIGPNDSGKSTALRGLQLVSDYACSLKSPGAELLADDGALTLSRGAHRLRLWRAGARGPDWALQDANGPIISFPPEVRERWTGARLLRLSADALREATPLLGDGPLDFLDARGRGLGSVLDGIFSRNVQDYLALEARLRELFPTVAGFRLFTSPAGRSIGVRLKDGTEVPPRYLSEGMLYFLAFVVVPFLQPSSLLLVEEPENGLHPSRIADVVRVLRAVSQHTQVVIATHSPLVINELQPAEVTVVTRGPGGTVFTRIGDTPNFEKRASVFALGELWLSYADGTNEAKLLGAPDRQ